MEAISEALQPYKNVIGTVAAYLTIAQFFSGAFICREIQKKGSTKDIDSFPFVGGIMVGLAMLKYGLILKDDATLLVNFFAIGLNIIYCVFYYLFSTDKWNEILKKLTVSIAFVAVLWGYTEWEDESVVEFRYGLIVTLLMFILLGSPLLGIQTIIEKKDASQIPFVMTIMGVIVTFSWLLYGFVLKNNFMIVQNVVGFTLCFVQLGLIIKYPGKPSQTSKKKIH